MIGPHKKVYTIQRTIHGLYKIIYVTSTRINNNIAAVLGSRVYTIRIILRYNAELE